MEDRKNNAQSVETYLTAFSTIVIPVVALLLGNMFSEAIKSKELEAGYIKIAVVILEQQPTEATINLREWAVDIIDEYSNVKVSEDLKATLVKETNLPNTNKVKMSDKEQVLAILQANSPLSREKFFAKLLDDNVTLGDLGITNADRSVTSQLNRLSGTSIAPESLTSNTRVDKVVALIVKS